MIEQIYAEYAVLTAKIKELTDKKDELKTQIMEDLAKNLVNAADTSVGSFVIVNLKTWTYTNKVAKLEEAYKAQKAMEESTGDATFKLKPSLRFTMIKL